MLILKSSLFSRYKEITFGFSSKIGLNRTSPYYFNMSYSVDDNHEVVTQNRSAFFNQLGLSEDKVAWQKQVHGNEVKFVDKAGCIGESDALITNKSGIGLAVSTADCTPIFIFDPSKKVIAAVHSGWRSTEKKILVKTLMTFNNVFNSNFKDLIVYIGPSISQYHYEVGAEVAKLFNQNFVNEVDDKLYLDVAGINENILIEMGVPTRNIQKSKLCTFQNRKLLHSYRRDGLHSGRALGVIALK